MFTLLFWLAIFGGSYLVPVGLAYLCDKTQVFGTQLAAKSIWANSLILSLTWLILLIFILLPDQVYASGIGNFWLHFFGGGVVVSVIFIYWRSLLKFKLPWVSQIILLYFVAAGFGVANELLEYALDSLGEKEFSATRLDTWRDLLANSLGAYSGWIFLSIIIWLLPSRYKL